MTELVFDPEVEITDQAMERKERFRKIKTEQGLDAINFDSMFPERRVYFNKQGEITCITQDVNFEPDPEWLTHDFTQNEIEMVCGNISSSRFSVYKVDDSYEIIQTNVKQPIGVSHGNDMVLVEEHTNSDVTVEISDTHITVSAVPKVCEELKQNNFTVGTVKVLPFHITLNGNPHYLIYNFYVPLGDLANKGSVKIPVEDDFTDYSVYTKPVFDSYGRV